MHFLCVALLERSSRGVVCTNSSRRSMSEVRGLELCLGVGVCAVAILIRLAVSLHPYSGKKSDVGMSSVYVCSSNAISGHTSVTVSPGAGQPVMFGDYEAQRHWMEITFHLPVKEW